MKEKEKHNEKKWNEEKNRYWNLIDWALSWELNCDNLSAVPWLSSLSLSSIPAKSDPFTHVVIWLSFSFSFWVSFWFWISFLFCSMFWFCFWLWFGSKVCVFVFMFVFAFVFMFMFVFVSCDVASLELSNKKYALLILRHIYFHIDYKKSYDL